MAKKTIETKEAPAEPEVTEQPTHGVRAYFVPGVGTVEAADIGELAEKVKDKKKEVGDANN